MNESRYKYPVFCKEIFLNKEGLYIRILCKIKMILKFDDGIAR